LKQIIVAAKRSGNLISEVGGTTDLGNVRAIPCD